MLHHTHSDGLHCGRANISINRYLTAPVYVYPFKNTYCILLLSRRVRYYTTRRIDAALPPSVRFIILLRVQCRKIPPGQKTRAALVP